MIKPYKGIYPTIDPSAYISELASVIGDVTIGKNVTVFDTATIRGDEGKITIKDNVNIQEHACLHTNLGDSLTIEKDVTVGHGAILHGCHIHERSLIGMGAIVLDNAVIQEDTIVAAGSLVSPNKHFEPGVMLMGSPAKVVREIKESEKVMMAQNILTYIELGQTYKKEKK